MKKIILSLILCSIPTVSYSYAQTQTAYNPAKNPKYDLGQGSNVDFDLNFRTGTDGVHIRIGTETCDGVGTHGVTVGTGPTQPEIHITYEDGSTTFNMKNMHVKKDGVPLNSGTITDVTLAGTTTLPPGSQISTGGRNLSTTEVSYLDGLTDFLPTLLASKEDDANKGAANGYASLDANVKVVENPTAATSTPGTNKIVMTDDSQYINDDWINPNNRVGSTSVSAHNDVNFPTTVADGQVLMFNDATGQWENNTSTASVAWGGITGNPNDQADTLMSQAEAEGGTNTAARMPSALRIQQAIDANLVWGNITGVPTNQTDVQVSQAEAEAGTGTSPRLFSAQRVAQAIAQLPGTTTPVLERISLGSSTAGAQIKGGETTGGVELLLHCDNPGTSTFTDYSRNNFTVTAGANAIGTTTAKFGSGGAYLDGTGDYLRVPDNDLWAFGTSSFTIAMQVKYTASTDDQMLYAQRTDASNQIQIYHKLSTNTLYFLTNGGAGISISWPWTESVGTFQHVEIVRNGSDFYVFVNGTSLGTQTSSTAIGNFTGPVYFGIDGDGAGNEFTGVLDEIYISKFARHTTNFTAPTAANAPNRNHVALYGSVGEGAKAIEITIGTSSVSSSGRNFDIASGLTTLADSWDTRCDPDLKEVINEDPALADQAYEKLKLAAIKRWKFKESDHEITGIMIDDPNIPEDIIWRTEDGRPGGFNGTGFMNFLYAVVKSLIDKTEKQKTEIENLKALLTPK